jgi:hypothetical protein
VLHLLLLPALHLPLDLHLLPALLLLPAQPPLLLPVPPPLPVLHLPLPPAVLLPPELKQILV